MHDENTHRMHDIHLETRVFISIYVCAYHTHGIVQTYKYFSIFLLRVLNSNHLPWKKCKKARKTRCILECLSNASAPYGVNKTFLNKIYMHTNAGVFGLNNRFSIGSVSIFLFVVLFRYLHNWVSKKINRNRNCHCF